MRLPFSEAPIAGVRWRTWITRVRRLPWRSLLIALLVLAGIGAVGGYIAREAISDHLEDMTGETELWPQLKGVVHVLRQPPIDTQDFTPARYADVYPFGANTFFEQEVEESKLRRSMDMLKAAGIRWVRQEFPWDRIEQNGKGQFVGPQGPTWPHYDRIVALARQYDLELVVRLDLPPRWSKRDNSVPRSPPDDFRDYGDFVEAVVRRYQGSIHYYQIWNEPNLALEWGGPPDAAAYVSLLRTAYTRAKTVDPSVVILSAPLSPTVGTPDGLNQSDLTYLQEMYDAGAAAYFDILSAQGYGLFTGPGDRRAMPDRINFSRVRLLREIMVRNGDAETAIWLSEMGWDAVPLDLPDPPIHGRVTEEQQASYTRAAYQRIHQEWPWIGVVFYWYFRRVSDDQRVHEDFYFRMVDPDFTTRPVYDAVRETAQRPPVVHQGLRSVLHWGLQYQGRWDYPRPPTAPGPPVAVSGTAGSNLSFQFQGEALSLVLATGPRAGRLLVEVDGSPSGANRVTLSGGEARINLARPEPEEMIAPIAAGLSSEIHTLSLTVAGDGLVELQGVLVAAPRAPFQQQIVALGLLLGALVVLATVAAVQRRGAS